MSVEDVLTMGQRIRVEALDAAIRTRAITPASKPRGDELVALAKTFEDYIARETRLSEKLADVALASDLVKAEAHV